MSDEEEYGVPAGAIILNELHIVEFIDGDDGMVYKMDLSHSGDDDLSSGKYFELCEWARMLAAAPHLAEMVRDYVYEEDEDE